MPVALERVRLHTEAAPQIQQHRLKKETSTTGNDELVALGYNPQLEANRARDLLSTLGENLGSEIAQHEQGKNREAYKREFLQDEAVSRPSTYYHYDGELYSYPHQHELTKVSNAINPDERDGLTSEGFGKFQDLVTGNHSDEVAVWYSPSGKGGLKPPFDKLHYESGRLYFAFRVSDGESIHIDIKMKDNGDDQNNTQGFKIKELLDELSGRQSQTSWDYLKDPFTLPTAQELFARLKAFGDTPEGQNLVYVTRRHSDMPVARRIEDVADEVRGALNYDRTDRKHSKNNREDTSSNMAAMTASSGSHSAYDLTSADAIHKGYTQEIRDYSRANGLSEVVLYGCSTTSSVDFGSSMGGTSYSSIRRASGAYLSGGSGGRGGAEMGESESGDEDVICCVCPFCNHEVMAYIENDKIHCPRKDEGCGKSAPYKKQ